MPKSTTTLLLLIPLALACTNYRKEADGACADICLDSKVGICPVSLIVKGGGLDEGLCSDIGYTIPDGEISQAAGPCGTLKFTKHARPTLFTSLNALSAAATTRPTSDEGCSWGIKSCSPSAYCSFQFQFGDLSLNQACRLIKDDDKQVCPNVETVPVEPEDYFSGRWYEIAASSGFKTKFEGDSNCISADYYFNSCNAKSPVTVVNNGINSDGTLNTAVGRAREAAGPGQFEVSFFGPFFGPYWVIHTESSTDNKYDVAIVFSCSTASQDMWVLSRSPRMSDEKLQKLLDLARSKDIDVDAMDIVKSDQPSDCAYPAPETLSQQPTEDSDCSFGLTGCSPSSWCSWQPRFGDLTPSQMCRTRPTQCADNTFEKDATTASDDSSSSGVSVGVMASVGAACVVGVVAGVVGAKKLRRRRTPLIGQEGLVSAEIGIRV